jgi:feruloyl-CoA synthase
VIPVSVAYSLMSTDHERVRYIAELTAPGAVFADDAGPFANALDQIAGAGRTVIVARGQRDGALRLDDLAATTPGSSVGAALETVCEDTTAKLLFTSGSTGVPKGVINTHRMLCSNQTALAQIWPFLTEEPPIMVDWLPWSHTFGGNHNLNLAIFNGGTLHIDDGKPAPPLFGRTISALSSRPPTVYFNVPAGYALLAPRLEADPGFAERFFSHLRFMFYAAAALPDALTHRLRAVAASVADHDVPLTSSWGATETAPGVTSAHFPDAVVGCMGVPLPGVTVKLAPTGDKLELRVAGPNITPGYFRDPKATAQAFDADGFYKTGDAGRLVDPNDPARGLLFDGRIAEDFKLITGTWVTVGPLRTHLVSTARVLTDAVITGHNGPYVGALAWINQVEARRLLEADDDVPLDDPALRAHIERALRELNDGQGSAARIVRVLLLAEPPSLDAGEITDKGYINQRRVLERRADLVTALHAEPCGPDIIVA